MIEIKTESGFSYSLPEARVKDNRELFDALVEYFEEKDVASRIMIFRNKITTLLLGEDGRRALYEHCRDEESGVVLSGRVDDEVFEILTTNKLIKN